MLRVSELNWQRLLFTRNAAIFLGIAAALSLGAVVIIHSDVNLNALSPIRRDALSFIGAASAFGFILLLVSMGFFWLKCDSSRRGTKTVWLLILLIGCPYGSAALYFAVVYLPAFRKRNVGRYEIDIQPTETCESRNRFGPFRRMLLVVWAVVVLPVVLVLSLARIPALFAEIAAIAFVVWSTIVILEAIFHSILSLYRSGMARSTGTDKSDSSRSRNRE